MARQALISHDTAQEANETDLDTARHLVATAQAHFTAALAAATAMAGHSGNGMSSDDFRAWDDVAGV